MISFKLISMLGGFRGFLKDTDGIVVTNRDMRSGYMFDMSSSHAQQVLQVGYTEQGDQWSKIHKGNVSKLFK